VTFAAIVGESDMNVFNCAAVVFTGPTPAVSTEGNKLPATTADPADRLDIFVFAISGL